MESQILVFVCGLSSSVQTVLGFSSDAHSKRQVKEWKG